MLVGAIGLKPVECVGAVEKPGVTNEFEVPDVTRVTKVSQFRGILSDPYA